MLDGRHGLPDVLLSDHSPFWDAGYDALMVTDTSLVRYSNQKQMSESIETIDLLFLAAVTIGFPPPLP